MRFIAILFVGLMLAAGAGHAEEARDAPLSSNSEAVGQQITPMLDTGGHMALIKDIAFTPDGQQIVSAGEDKTIRVWDVASAKTVRTIRGEIAPGGAGKILAMALSPDGKWLAVGGMFHQTNAKAGSIIRLYNFASGQLVALLKGHKNVVVGLAFSPDSRHLISGSTDKTAIIWEVATGKELRRLKGHHSYIFAVGFTPDGARAVTGSSDHELRLWSVESGALLATMTGHKDKVYSVAIAPDGTIASGDDSGEIRLWGGQTGRFLKTFAQQKTKVGNLSYSPDGTRLLSSCGQYCEGNFKQIVYDTASGRETVTYRGHDNIVIANAISPDGRWAATGGGSNNEIHIWDLGTGKRRLGADGQPLSLSGSGRPVWTQAA
jgi:WD40 repeat protein